ncbi:hypothetical protein Tco_0801595 [Tanacetum coccineum]|uniref:Uncharacterized protein n=1 Tax=Tanacetum coccineum TaxID=301880 RepID=A0ABQ4ZZY3_9ASTR
MEEVWMIFGARQLVSIVTSHFLLPPPSVESKSTYEGTTASCKLPWLHFLWIGMVLAKVKNLNLKLIGMPKSSNMNLRHLDLFEIQRIVKSIEWYSFREAMVDIDEGVL